MKNITVSVDEEVYRAARVAAAENNTSVSALVRHYLKELAAARAEGTHTTVELFQALDRARNLRAASRLTRDEAHAR